MQYFISFLIFLFLVQPVQAEVFSNTNIDQTDVTGSVGALTITPGLSVAIAYVQQHADENPDWATMALRGAGTSTAGITVSSGSQPIDLARIILATVAIGGDPSALADQLEVAISGGHLGSNTYINDDIFGVLALVAAGRDPAKEPLQSLTSYIIGRQRLDGGWGLAATSLSDVDDTASAIEALGAAGQGGRVINQGVAYLQAQRNSDGAWPFRQPSSSNSASTSWAMQALIAAGVGVDGAATGALLSFQNGDGGWLWQTTSTASTELLTSYAVMALSKTPLPVAVFHGVVILPVPDPALVLPPITQPVVETPITSEVVPPAPTTQVASPDPSPAVSTKKIRPKLSKIVLGASTRQLAVTGPSIVDWIILSQGLALISFGLFKLRRCFPRAPYQAVSRPSRPSRAK